MLVGVTDTLNVNYNDGFVWLGGVDLSAKATETIHVRDSANINFSTGTDNSLKSITVYAINTQNDFTLNSLSASGSHSYIGGFPAVDGFLNVGRDFLLSAEASNLSLESNSISVSGATTFLLNNSDVHFGASSVVSHGVFELKSTGSNASVGISQLTAGKSGWSIYMGTSNTSHLTLDDFKFSGGGTLDIHLSHFSISAKSTQKGGQVDVTFNFNDALINNAFRTQELAYETKDARDFVTLQNFTFTSSPTLKVSGAGNHEKISVDPTAAASILNAAINTKLTADDLVRPSSAGSYSGLYTYNGDSYFFGFSDGDSSFEKGEMVIKFASNESINPENIQAVGNNASRSSIPEVLSSNPPKNSLDVHVKDTAMRLEFDQTICWSGLSGEITLQIEGGEIVERFDVATASSEKILVSGSSVTITAEKLDYDTKYVLNVPDDIFKNSGSELSAGTEITFQTIIGNGQPGKIYTPIIFTNARLNLDAFPSLANVNIPQTILDNVLAVLEGREAEPHGLIGEDFNDPEALLNLINALQATISEIDTQRAALGSITGTLDERMQVVAASQSGDISAEALIVQWLLATLLELIKAQIQSLIDEQLTALSNISEPVALELLNND